MAPRPIVLLVMLAAALAGCATGVDERPPSPSAAPSAAPSTPIEDGPRSAAETGGPAPPAPPTPPTAPTRSPVPASGPADAPSNKDPWSALERAEPTCCARIPFAHAFDEATGKLVAVVGDERYQVEFGAWGGHGQGHTGHVEGDNKANFRILVRPAAAGAVEMAGDPIWGRYGDGDGICEADEACGITDDDARASAPWYVAQDGLHLVSITRDPPPPQGEYLDGEDKLRVVLYRNGTRLALQHVGELAPEMVDLLRDAGEDAVLSAAPGAGEVQLSAPLAVPEGTRIARPQLTANGPGVVVAGVRHHFVSAQTEWSWERISFDHAEPTACQYDLFSADDRAALQRAMDANFLTPSRFGSFAPGPDGAPVAIETVAESEICASRTQDAGNYRALSTENGYGWFDYAQPEAHGGVVAVYPIHRGSAAYAARRDDFASPDVAFMLIRGFHEPIHQDGVFEMRDGATTYRLKLVSAQVLDLSPERDTPASDSFLAKVERVRLAEGSQEPTGMYFGARYALREDRLILAWSELAPTADAVALPPPVPLGDVACDERPYHCYTHDLRLAR